jgi:restriction system protein
MLPLLRYTQDGAEHRLKDAVQSLAAQFKLTDEELNEFLPSGQQPVFINRIGWARTYLKKAGLLLQSLKSCDATLFERIVVEVLVKMGYGGSRTDAGKAIGKTGDEGIDGVIKEDHLGLDNIYIQAKRWQATVGRPEIQKFAGALQGQRARKGVFITTSDFSRDASEYVSRIDSKIVLIDGNMLSRLMIDFSVGVTSVANYEVKKIDSDYFSDT